MAALLLLVLMGCEAPLSGGGESYDSIGAVAAAAECTEVEPEDEPMMFASETATCTLEGGDTVTINMFNNDEARDNYVKVGTANGAAYVLGGGWAIECENHNLQSVVADSTGGDTKG